MALPLTDLEKLIVQTDLDTLEFARQANRSHRAGAQAEAAKDERVPLLAQLPGVSILTALTILAAIGTIDRFEDAKHLVGYAGLGTRVHDSGQVHRNGRITKAGRKDLRRAMVNAANKAVQHHPFLEEGIRAVGSPPGTLQGDRGHCPQAAGGCLAHPDQ